MKWKLLAANYRSNRLLYWMILPVVLFVIIFSYIPMLGLSISFQDYSLTKGIFGSTWIGFENFVDFFNSMYFGRTFRNTIVLSLLNLLFCFPAPIILALMLNEVKNVRYKRLVQTVSYMPHFISMIVVAGLIIEFTNSSGVIASIVKAFGGKATSYIALPQYFRSIFIVSDIWQNIGFNSIIYLAALSGIVLMSRVNSGQPMNGNGMEMDALIACVVGGISVTGGEGKATGMIGGMLVMGILANGMAVAGMSEYLQMLVKGAVLVAVVAIDCFSRHHSLKSLLKK